MGRLWSHFAEHRRKKIEDPKNTGPYRLPHDLSFDAYYAGVQEAYLPDEQPTGGHLFTKKDSNEVQQLFWFTEVRELLREHKYAERPIRKMTEAELSLKSRDAGEIDPRESVPPECLAADFLKVIHLLGPELEVGLYTKLEGKGSTPMGEP